MILNIMILNSFMMYAIRILYEVIFFRICLQYFSKKSITINGLFFSILGALSVFTYSNNIVFSIISGYCSYIIYGNIIIINSELNNFFINLYRVLEKNGNKYTETKNSVRIISVGEVHFQMLPYMNLICLKYKYIENSSEFNKIIKDLKKEISNYSTTKFNKALLATLSFYLIISIFLFTKMASENIIAFRTMWYLLLLMSLIFFIDLYKKRKERTTILENKIRNSKINNIYISGIDNENYAEIKSIIDRILGKYEDFLKIAQDKLDSRELIFYRYFSIIDKVFMYSLENIEKYIRNSKILKTKNSFDIEYRNKLEIDYNKIIENNKNFLEAIDETIFILEKLTTRKLSSLIEIDKNLLKFENGGYCE